MIKNLTMIALLAGSLSSFSALAGTIPVTYVTSGDFNQAAPASVTVVYRLSSLDGTNVGPVTKQSLNYNRAFALQTNDNNGAGPYNVPTFGVQISSVIENGVSYSVVPGKCSATDGYSAGPAETVKLVREALSDSSVVYRCMVFPTKVSE